MKLIYMTHIPITQIKANSIQNFKEFWHGIIHDVEFPIGLNINIQIIMQISNFLLRYIETIKYENIYGITICISQGSLE